MRKDSPRPEHRAIDPHADGVINLSRSGVELRCSKCRPFTTKPVRYSDDPETVVRCAQCGKKHSKSSLQA